VVNGRLLLGALYEWSMVDFYWGLFMSGQW